MSQPSYASVTAKDAPPAALQPHPNPAFLNTEPPSHDNIADDVAKINIVGPDFKEHPETVTSTQDVPREDSATVESHARRTRRSTPADRARKYAHQAEDEGFYLWNYAQHYILRPSVAGGLLGIGASKPTYTCIRYTYHILYFLVNVGLLGWAGYNLYTKPYLRHDRRLLATGAAVALGLFGVEGYAAEKYLETPAGREEERKAREEGALLYRKAREIVLRPGVLGGMVGLCKLFPILPYPCLLTWFVCSQ